MDGHGRALPADSIMQRIENASDQSRRSHFTKNYEDVKRGVGVIA